MNSRRANRTPKRIATLLIALSLAVSACGIVGGDTDPTNQASVSVGGIESGCAEAINLRRLLDGAPHPSMTTIDMRQFASGAASLDGAFDDRTPDVDDYMTLVTEVVGRAADAADAQDNPTAEQILLLLDFEKAGRVADFERLTPGADAYFAGECGVEYSNAMVDADESGDTAASIAADEAAGASTDDAAVAESDDDPAVDDPVVGDPAVDDPVVEDEVVEDPIEIALVTEDTSVGATGTYLTMDIEIGEVIRTNLTPSAALNGGSELGEGEIVMVGVRLSSTGGYLYSPLSNFSWASSDGNRMTPLDAVAPTGAEWDATVDKNESKSGFLIFPADVGVTDGAHLLLGGGESVAERIPLGQGATSSVYPVALTAGQTGSGILTNGTSTSCEYPSNFEIRQAAATLNAQGNSQVLRPAENERFITVDLAVKVEEVNGNACDWATTVYGNLTDIRLRLDNGDVVPPTSTDFNGEVGITVVPTLSFPVPTATTSFELIVAGDEPIAAWSEVALPDA